MRAARVGTDTRESHRRALLNFNFQPMGDESHDAGRLHPRNLLELRLTLGQGNEKDVATDIAAQNFHDLCASDVVGAGYFNVVAGLNAEAPGTFAIAVERRRGNAGR